MWNKFFGKGKQSGAAEPRQNLNPEEMILIDARANLAATGSLTAILVHLFEAKANFEAKAKEASPENAPCYEAIAAWSDECMRAIYTTATEIIKRCRPVVDGGGSYDPYAGMAVTDCLVVLEKLKEILDGQIALPISQWDRELAIDALERQHFPALWQLCVWLSAAWHQLEDVMELRQAMMRFVSMGEIFENRRGAGEQLNRMGIINALHVYRDARLRGLTEPDQGIIAEACAEGLRDFGHETEDRARRAVNAGDLTPDARYLDAKDVMHLGLHSQMRRVGGVFLSHRGPDCKRALMDLYGKPRPTIFLDIWARPRGDTNRRFLWRNLGASEEMHAFVTSNYAASNYCLKEVEAWGLLSAARGHSPEATPGSFMVINDAPSTFVESGGAGSPLCAWALRRRRNESTIESALRFSREAVDMAKAPLGVRLGESEAEASVSDEWNRGIFASAILSPRPGETTADIPAMMLAHEPIAALLTLMNRAIELLKTDASATDELRQVLIQIEQIIPERSPDHTSQFRALLRSVIEHLATAIELKRRTRTEPFYYCLLHVLQAVVIMTDHISTGLEDSDPGVFSRSLVYLGKFGASLDSVVSQIGTLSLTLTRAGFYLVDQDALSGGLLLGLLPVNHESDRLELRIDSTFEPAMSASMVNTIVQAGLDCRTVQVVCEVEPYFWQCVVVIAAVASFPSRNYLFIDAEGGRSLETQIGGVKMEDFAHVIVACIEDLPQPLINRPDIG
ncbi:hypothetical protein [Bradyrhizobium sp. AUGA SZCCT0160]|uniref:hypothetical protein n=1 Tax=Bradyrhizobium sp. AUGA SZCCT0160 TaxID=2807662 RepID=UPI001BA60044|nr:hypothetical protein [Bradyrhizobium sp. AUGA SZCCT0160]MBR1190725.1 hypothetical protein [Bradyrhizobium sp. AUGA SZCCT0160]